MRYGFTIMLFILTGCQGREGTGSAQNQKLDSLIAANNKLEEQIKKADTIKSVHPDSSLKSANNFLVTLSTKYCFVLLTITQTEPVWGKEESYYYCTNIQEYSFVDEELKYRLMDEAQASYLSSYSAALNKGKVNSRKCFAFDTYLEASKGREKYIIDK